MKSLILFVCLPFVVLAFEPLPVNPEPVVGFREISFFDEPNAINRKVLVWYPVPSQVAGKPSDSPWDVFMIAQNAPIYNEEVKKPVVIISHGYTGNPHQLSWLVRWLVHNQFIVLGIQHRDLIDGHAHVNHWQRASDISKMIDAFSKSEFENLADLNQIFLAGYSLGGTTAMWISGGRTLKLDSLIPTMEFAAPEDYTRSAEALPTLNKEMMQKDWREPRVKAVFVMAPAWAWLFDEESLRSVTIPTYFIASSGDRVLVTKNNAGLFARNIPNAIFREIPGNANHYIFISKINADMQRETHLPRQLNQMLLSDDSGVDRTWIQHQVAQEAVRFFEAKL